MKCVFCEKEFEKLSCEHIIPNVLCGHLKSNKLLWAYRKQKKTSLPTLHQRLTAATPPATFFMGPGLTFFRERNDLDESKEMAKKNERIFCQLER